MTPPRPSPAARPDTDRSLDPDLDEPKTDPGLRFKLVRMEQAINAQREEELKKHDNKLTIRSVIIAGGALISGIVSVFIFIDNRVQAQTDAGVQVMKSEQKAQDARLTTLEKRFDRFDAKMDLMLDAQRVPAWKRPPLLDGGQPPP